jgi:hypothetical protein
MLGVIFLAVNLRLMEQLAEAYIIVVPVALLILPVIYLLSLRIAGRVSGSRQARLLAAMGLPAQDWRKFNTRAMVLSGLLGPLGGFAYGAAASARLIKMICRIEETQAAQHAPADSAGAQEGASLPGVQIPEESAPEGPALKAQVAQTSPPDHSASEVPASEDENPRTGSLVDRPVE